MATNNPNQYGMSGAYAAIWNALEPIIEQKNAQAVELFDNVNDQLVGLDGGSFDKSRVDALLQRLDAITPPQEPVLPSTPSVRTLQYTARSLPTLSPVSPEIPQVPAERRLMDIGPAPDISEAGDDMDLNSFRNLFTHELEQVLGRAKTGFEEFVQRFLPVSQHADDALQWLSDAVHARNTGVPVHIEAQLYERHRTRLDKETNRQIEGAMSMWAAKGFKLPPGALQGQVAQIRRDQHDQLATSSREIAIYVSDKHIENARFAVEQLLSLRNQAMAHAMDYFKALLISPQNAGQWITAMLDNRTKVAGARADIYKARAGVAADVLRAQTGADVDTFKALTDAEVQSAKAHNDAQTDTFRALLEQERHTFTALIEEFKARTGNEVDVYKAVQDSMTRFYEAATRVAGLKAEVLGKTADTALKIEELQFGRDTQVAKMKVDTATEMLKTIAQQASAALNNLQMSANSGVNHSYSYRMESE